MFSIKDTLNESFASLASNWRPYLFISAIYSVAIMATSFLSPENFLAPEAIAEDLTLFFILLAIGVLIQTLIIYAVFAWLVEKGLAIYRGVYEGLNIKKVLPRIIPAIILGVILQFLITIGFILLIIPGIYLTLRYSQAIIALIDGKGIFESMKYSAQITKGKKLKLLGAYFLISIINVALMGIFILPLILSGMLFAFLSLGMLVSSVLIALIIIIPMVAVSFLWIGIMPTIYEKLKGLYTA